MFNKVYYKHNYYIINKLLFSWLNILQVICLICCTLICPSACCPQDAFAVEQMKGRLNSHLSTKYFTGCC